MCAGWTGECLFSVRTFLYCHKLSRQYEIEMESFDLRLIEEYDGTKDIIEWLEKVELVCKIRDLKDLALVIPLRLTGGAFSVYQQLSTADKASAEKIKAGLKGAFAIDSFTAYEKFIRRHLATGESVDVYLADLKKLAVLFGCTDEKVISCAFLSGLPDRVKQTLRASAKIEGMSLAEIVERSRMLLSADEEVTTACAASDIGPPRGVAGAVAGARNFGASSSTYYGRRRTVNNKCFRCGSDNHFIRDCPEAEKSEGQWRQNSRLCYKCSSPHHVARDCTLNSVEEK